MKVNSWRWLLGLGLATAMCLNTMAQDGSGKHHKHGHGDKGKHRTEISTKRNLSDKIFKLTQADSVQKAKMKPVVEHASKRLETLRLSYQQQEKRVLDSLKLQVKPYLKEDQLKRLSDWNEKTGRR